jgi:hypothetical protein
MAKRVEMRNLIQSYLHDVVDDLCTQNEFEIRPDSANVSKVWNRRGHPHFAGANRPDDSGLSTSERTFSFVSSLLLGNVFDQLGILYRLS